jgi:hypothetical protein
MSEIEYRFLTLEDVLELHEMQLVQYGGATGIRDRGLDKLLTDRSINDVAHFWLVPLGVRFTHK